MSIARCAIELRALNFLVGPNGAGKSNFLDALRFTADSLNTSVEHALRDRGGISEVRRRSAGHPTNFGVRLEWSLPNGNHGLYAFRIGAKPQGAFEVQREHCVVHFANPTIPSASYEVHSGQIHGYSLASPPAAASDRLFLVAVSGQPEFRPLYDALLRLGLYNFNPDVIRELQAPDPGEVLASDGRNLASVLKRMAEQPNGPMKRMVELLGKVVPGIKTVSHRPVGKKETLEFRQLVAGSKDAWRFDAENMSDGTLRSLGVLVALFQPPASDGRAVRVVGIEEPETALHPGAAAVLRSALFEASRHTQILVTSHSPDLLDDKQISADAIISVISRGGETILGSVDAASRSSIRDQLFTAGELLRLNQIETDETVHQAITAAQLDLFDRP
ncbi:MAG TPA: AAA family ATPase [Verrucomicrobiota bacterium]|nr:AAA family ATPase [Verrucomicrobiota bacterium]